MLSPTEYTATLSIGHVVSDIFNHDVCPWKKRRKIRGCSMLLHHLPLHLATAFQEAIESLVDYLVWVCRQIFLGYR